MPLLLAAMQVVLLGTGYPRPYPDRAGPSTAVVIDGRYFIVDAGRAVVLRLAVTSTSLPPIAAVFLTHLHSDHISGLPDLFDTSWDMGRKQPLQLYGPAGTEAVVAGILKMYEADIHIRRDLTEDLPPAGARIELHRVEEGVVYRDSAVTVTAFAVDHRPVAPAFGYRFESGGKTIVISGDTAPSENLIRFAHGADILVHEVYLPGTFSFRDKPSVAERLGRYHTDALQVGRIAARAGVKKLVLTHVIPPQAAEQIRALAAQGFKGEIAVGKDLDGFSP